LTDSQHHLLYPSPFKDNSYVFPELRYDFTWLVYAYAAYSYLVSLVGLVVLIRRFIYPHRLYRRQILTVAFGFTLPLIFTILTTAGVDFKPFRDITPITFGIGNLVVAWGLFRFRTFKVTPVARDHIFEAMIDPVVVLDNHNNIVDINSAMLDLLGMNAQQTIGKPANVVFDEFSIPIKMYAQVSYARVETSYEVQGKTVYYEMTVWPLFNNERKMIGRIYISHDITALKELETELRGLNRDLEERVQIRTHELAEAYDTTLEG
jgi:PAS domain S-box-containing protein